jgi:hypothetical protein
MALEKRRNGYYYYSKKRINGSVRSDYEASGELALQMAKESQAKRTAKDLNRKLLRSYKSVAEEIDSSLRSSLTATQGLLRGLLTTIGYHHHRGEWRKKRK